MYKKQKTYSEFLKDQQNKDIQKNQLELKSMLQSMHLTELKTIGTSISVNQLPPGLRKAIQPTLKDSSKFLKKVNRILDQQHNHTESKGQGSPDFDKSNKSNLFILRNLNKESKHLNSQTKRYLQQTQQSSGRNKSVKQAQSDVVRKAMYAQMINSPQVHDVQKQLKEKKNIIFKKQKDLTFSRRFRDNTDSSMHNGCFIETLDALENEEQYIFQQVQKESQLNGQQSYDEQIQNFNKNQNQIKNQKNYEHQNIDQKGELAKGQRYFLKENTVNTQRKNQINLKKNNFFNTLNKKQTPFSKFNQQKSTEGSTRTLSKSQFIMVNTSIRASQQSNKNKNIKDSLQPQVILVGSSQRDLMVSEQVSQLQSQRFITENNQSHLNNSQIYYQNQQSPYLKSNLKSKISKMTINDSALTANQVNLQNIPNDHNNLNQSKPKVKLSVGINSSKPLKRCQTQTIKNQTAILHNQMDQMDQIGKQYYFVKPNLALREKLMKKNPKIQNYLVLLDDYMFSHCESSLQCMKEKQNSFTMLINKLTELIFLALALNNIPLIIRVISFCGELFAITNDYEFAINLQYQAFKLAVWSNNIEIRTNIYHQIGYLLLKTKKYEQAISTFNKSLEVVMFNQSKEQELETYDFIGRVFFEINDLNKAAYYHQRAVNNKLEEEDSIVRIIACKNIQRDLNKELMSIKEIDENNQYIQRISIFVKLQKQLIEFANGYLQVEVNQEFYSNDAYLINKKNNQRLRPSKYIVKPILDNNIFSMIPSLNNDQQQEVLLEKGFSYNTIFAQIQDDPYFKTNIRTPEVPPGFSQEMQEAYKSHGTKTRILINQQAMKNQSEFVKKKRKMRVSTGLQQRQLNQIGVDGKDKDQDPDRHKTKIVPLNKANQIFLSHLSPNRNLLQYIDYFDYSKAQMVKVYQGFYFQVLDQLLKNGFIIKEETDLL